MKVCFDGLRTRTTQSMNGLYTSIQNVLNDLDDSYDVSNENKEELITRFNEVSMYINNFNMLSSSKDENFSSMDDLSVKILKGNKNEI